MMQLITLFLIIFALVAAAIGSVFGYLIVRGSRDVVRARRMATDGRLATGTIVDNQTESYGDGQMVFRPVIQYRTEAGATVTAVGPAPSRRSFVVGSGVTLSYDPADPNQIQLTSGPGSGSGGPARIVVGVLGLVVVLGMLAVAWTMYQVGSGPECANLPFPGDPTC